MVEFQPRRSAGNEQKHESSNPLQRSMIGRFHSEVIRLLGIAQPDAVLDLGCGEGYVLQALVDAGVTARLVGVDRSATAVEAARQRLLARAEIIEDDVGAGHDLAGAFDVVMMLEVLEHLDDPAGTLDMLAALTSGHVIVSVPREPYFRGMNLLRLKNMRRWGSDPEHVQHWTRSGFGREVEGLFTVVERGHAFPWTLLLLRPRSGSITSRPMGRGRKSWGQSGSRSRS